MGVSSSKKKKEEEARQRQAAAAALGIIRARVEEPASIRYVEPVAWSRPGATSTVTQSTTTTRPAAVHSLSHAASTTATPTTINSTPLLRASPVSKEKPWTPVAACATSTSTGPRPTATLYPRMDEWDSAILRNEFQRDLRLTDPPKPPQLASPSKPDINASPATELAGSKCHHVLYGIHPSSWTSQPLDINRTSEHPVNKATVKPNAPPLNVTSKSQEKLNLKQSADENGTSRPEWMSNKQWKRKKFQQNAMQKLNRQKQKKQQKQNEANKQKSEDQVSDKSSWASNENGNSGGHEQLFHATRYEQLQLMLDKDPREATFNLSDPALGFKELLDMDVLAPARLVAVVKLLAVVSLCDECPQTKMALLKNVICSKFFDSTLLDYLARPNSEAAASDEVLDDLVTILDEMLNILPTIASTRAPTLIRACLKRLAQGSGDVVDQDLRKDFQELAQIADNVSGRGRNKQSFEKRLKEELVQAQVPPEDFRTMSITPTLMDAHDNKLADFLRPNLVGQAYQSDDHYLDVHFRLMREDFVASLRQSVQLYLKKKTARKLACLKLYEAMAYFDVRVADLNCQPYDGVLHVLSFEVSKMSGQKAGDDPVDWEDTKRLKSGSLVCLSSDDFQSFHLAIVAYNDYEKLAKGCLNVKFLDESSQLLFGDATYVMIECPAYYMAYAPVMKALQAMGGDGELLPFERYLVRAKTKVKPPKYLTASTVYELGSTIFNRSNGQKDGVRFRPLEAGAWPSKETLGLDQAQHAALRLALTSELALVQGPPGTGKTFLGLKIVECLLANRDCWSAEDKKRPILIICYTNHALDQFLEGLLDFAGTGIVRVGGQCDSKSLQGFRLGKLVGERQGQIPRHVYVYRKLLLKEMGKQEREIRRLMVMASSKSECWALDEDVLAGVMGDAHRAQFDTKRTLHQWLELDVQVQLADGKRMEHEVIEEILCRELRSVDSVMQKDVALKVADVWTLALRNRWRMFRTWMKELRLTITHRLRELCRDYEDKHERLKEARAEMEAIILGNAKIVGMTTSGAAKNRHLLTIIKPTIVVVEEAAEVLEAHIVAALTRHCQHLIMIGDQQQLRPNPTMYELAKNYGMDVSLFERLIRNEVSYERLVMQHRMRPQISRLLVPHIYPTLLDHSKVNDYPHVVGLADDVFFVTHDKQESMAVGTTSRSNRHESDYVVALAQYLVRRAGYLPSQITVLATYKGQVQVLAAALDTLVEAGLQCSSIDAYQGAENDIVIVSLVRSNRQGNVGFLKTENRVCVLLSRARHAFYCVGNFNLLAGSAPVWKAIVNKQKTLPGGGLGPALKLTCPYHTGIVTGSATWPEDLINATEQHNCCRPCDVMLPCGHLCPQQCHGKQKELLMHNSMSIDCANKICLDRRRRRRRPDDEDDDPDQRGRRITNRSVPNWESSPAGALASRGRSSNMPRYYRAVNDDEPRASDLISFV